MLTPTRECREPRAVAVQHSGEPTVARALDQRLALRVPRVVRGLGLLAGRSVERPEGARGRAAARELFSARAARLPRHLAEQHPVLRDELPLVPAPRRPARNARVARGRAAGRRGPQGARAPHLAHPART